jgi:hypothetical protein
VTRSKSPAPGTGTAIGAFNAKYFGNRLIFLGAVRVDSFFNHVRQQISAGDYDAATWNGLNYLFKPNAPSDWTDLTFTPRPRTVPPPGPSSRPPHPPADGNGNPQPQYARDRFKDDYNAPAIEQASGDTQRRRRLSPHTLGNALRKLR